MDDLNRAFALWLDITSFDPQLTRFRAGDVDISHISQMNTMIEESLKLDSSSITTYLLLDYFVETYLDSKSFCVNEVLGDFEGFNTYLTKCKELYTILRSENLISLRKQIEESVLSALTHYGIDNPDTEDMVRNHHNLAFLRRDALRSMESLEIHQFYQGQPATEKPKYYTHVFEFRNINSLLKSVVNSRNSGVSLSLIREPSTLESFFVFGIRNGSTVSFLTDRPQTAHPMQGEMSRRRGKSFNERWGKHHFPYGLLGLDFDRRGDAYAAKTPGIVPYQEIARKLIPIKDMAPDEIIWTIMMFSLIEQKHWKEDFKAEELSYTGEMIVTHNAALDGANALALTNYQSIEIGPMTSNELSTTNMLDEWECTSTRQNEWIEKRYSHLVNDSVLFLMGDESNLKLLPECDQPTLVKDYDLRLMSGTTFGTQEKLISDVRWHARYNKAKILNKFVHDEYEKTKKGIYGWYKEKVTDNIENLLKAVACGSFETQWLEIHPLGFKIIDEDKLSSVTKNILTISTIEKCRWSGNGILFHRMSHSGYDRTCYLTGSPIFIRAYFTPSNAQALADLCNCSVEGLPDVLQHWTDDRRYSGNSILNRVDPLEWVVKNPWHDLNLTVEIELSKAGYNQLRKREGFGPNKFWADKSNNAAS